ncbi:MAG: trypsin-like peptidase domain-containing protein [Kiritimatiellae bacterium]|nr:trypsin-like peptidase domain-containing protein [Kiritimatiellia bacterium]
MKGLKKTALLALSALLLSGAPLARAVSVGAAKAMSSAVADIVERAMPAVVVVRTESTGYSLAQDWMFGRIYRLPERLAGMGSGVIINKEGFVLTNGHVVDGAQQIEVVLNDQRKYSATLVGQDPQTDLAVLRINTTEKTDFPFLEMGDSDALRVGEFVMAIGSPFSLSSSVTLGIVSQKGRAIGALPYEDFIQTDAAVNRGNSGGPLVDMDGKMVGINTIIQTTGYSQGNIGISFAIPINLASEVAQSIMRNGRWQRPWIGIQMEDTGARVIIRRVIPHSPAEAAGLQSGDIIAAINENAIQQAREVQRLIMSQAPGTQVTIRVLRDGNTIDLSLATEAMPLPKFPAFEE